MKKLFCIFAFCCMLFAEDVDSAKNSTSSNLNIEIQNSYKIKFIIMMLKSSWVICGSRKK
ncbi:hypothetical protein [uncultured Campylobacter sp.]|uniref:hypothetical protein n=1 Tax=uncultured Campylobacter sp. TaxID=218934 RepID=UPI00261756EF|nr:hypothetical protein [uncultured Campylobacter sp.]